MESQSLFLSIQDEDILAQLSVKNLGSSVIRTSNGILIFRSGSLRKNFSDIYNLLVNGKFAYDYLHYRSDPRLDVTTMYIDNHYRQQEAYASAAHLFNITKWWSASISNDFHVEQIKC
jgi:hypothetical protein